MPPSDCEHVARWQRSLGGGRVQCLLCPRGCRLEDGERGFCFVRRNLGGRLIQTTYGRCMGLAVDPIEKKPLYHFHPGSTVLSFGTAGCNLGCRFCQNWNMSRATATDAHCERAAPEDLARQARRLGCRSVAFTYNEPTVFAEYALATAEACRAEGVATVAVTNGYISARARAEFFAGMDAANVDLKAFSDTFYRDVCDAALAPVLETLEFLRRETDVWFEITTLLIPGHNDDATELEALARWVVERLGPEVPLHFTAFHPAHKMTDVPATTAATLRRARAIGRDAGLRYVYTGNVRDPEGAATWCPSCGARVIERDGYRLGAHNLCDGCCAACGAPIAGRF